MKIDEEYYEAVKIVLQNANLRNKTSVKIAQSLALSRFSQSEDAEIRYMGLSLYTEFSLKMLNVKFFEILKDKIEKESKNFNAHLADKYVTLMRRVA